MTMKIKRLDFAHIMCKDSILSCGGNEKTATLIGCFAYLVHRGGEYMLVDCGIEDMKTVNDTKASREDWIRDDTEGSIVENLTQCGVYPAQISKVFLTHSHYDHLSGILPFKNAEVYMSKKEYQYMQSEENRYKKYLKEQIAFLKVKEAEGKLFLIDDTYEKDKIKCQVVGGHTPGSMLVTIGDCLFTGDVVFLVKNIENELPIGFCENPKEAQEAVRLCKRHKGVILTGHDLLCPKIVDSKES